MKDVLFNPVFHALSSGDKHLGSGSDTVKFSDAEVSPLVGFADDHIIGFHDLLELLPPERRILYATPRLIDEPAGWSVKAEVRGLQFIYPADKAPVRPSMNPVKLDSTHIDEMIALTALTKPGPFDRRTIEFGSYHGFFENGKLVSMTGQRMHVYGNTEISAVCTHPDHLGKGYAAALLLHQLHIILDQKQQPFLHVRADNQRAIDLYERLGFCVNREMNFYFMKRK